MCIRDRFLAVAQRYSDIFSGVGGLGFGPGFSQETANSTCNVQFEAPIASHVVKHLVSEGIEARKWWNNGCHNEPIFSKCPREDLQDTQFLADRVVGLPFFGELSRAAIIRIRDGIERAFSR